MPFAEADPGGGGGGGSELGWSYSTRVLHSKSMNFACSINAIRAFTSYILIVGLVDSYQN